MRENKIKGRIILEPSFLMLYVRKILAGRALASPAKNNVDEMLYVVPAAVRRKIADFGIWLSSM
jgi:hypothetical protein